MNTHSNALETARQIAAMQFVLDQAPGVLNSYWALLVHSVKLDEANRLVADSVKRLNNLQHRTKRPERQWGRTEEYARELHSALELLESAIAHGVSPQHKPVPRRKLNEERPYTRPANTTAPYAPLCRGCRAHVWGG